MRQQVLTNNFNKGHTPQGPPRSSYSYDQDMARKELASAIIMHEYPLSIVEHVGFKSDQKKGFMAVTTHFIDDSWTLQSHIMRFVYVPCPQYKRSSLRAIVRLFDKLEH
ncbi:hypothetical protein Vadar_027841 [Vaccinium darrowii]|uniref:Uncharacterized protein n=1 Tax=Vaccinium darrowii TaxID=229202 RepID=A0ACB7Z956_9ERIC|nr:hypothetical protein Vadar_027841 [Vaccinium darrowii]